MSAASFSSGLQNPRSREPITHQKILFVEGKTPFYFFLGFLRHLTLENDIEIRNFGGIRDLRSALKLLVITPGFPGVISLGIIRDAETDARSSFDSVCSGLRAAGLSVPPDMLFTAAGTPNTSVLILPDCVSSGMLESLCLQAVRADPAIPCIDQYFDCLEHLGAYRPDNISKARVQAFLSSRERAGLLLGEAALAGFIPWENSAFDQARQFLRAL
jgi:hypothetical protein